MAGVPAISLERITCTFVSREDRGKRYTAVKDTTLVVGAGEFVSVVGPTGCGKSTLLNVAAGLLAPSSGSVTVLGEPLRGINSRAGYLFQQDALTRQAFQAARTRLRIASAAVIEAETILDYTRLTAPFDGVISRKLVSLGDLAVPGRPLIIIEESATLRFEADVPAAHIAHTHLGAKLAIRLPALQKELIGTVSEISPASPIPPPKPIIPPRMQRAIASNRN